MFILSLLSTLVALDFCVTAAQAHCPCWGLAKVRAYNWHSLLQPWGGSNLSYLHRWPFQDQTSAPGEHAEIGAIWFPRFQATLLGCDEMTAMPANSLSQPLVSAFLNSLYFPCNPCATRHSFFSHLTPIIFSLRRCFPLKKKKKRKLVNFHIMLISFMLHTSHCHHHLPAAASSALHLRTQNPRCSPA